ncbi:MAG: hypothetical protein GF401_06040 [Chitinivibrionales bacterium]|nr:hypothetical protein [Chitinivibrionales bacterium]
MKLKNTQQRTYMLMLIKLLHTAVFIFFTVCIFVVLRCGITGKKSNTMPLSSTNRNAIRPFTTDDCTCTPEGTKENPTLWKHCCNAHDSAYWRGGSFNERRGADSLLAECLAEVGQKRRGKRWYKALFFTGAAWLPTPWRWGYGWKYPRSYRRLKKLNKQKLIADSTDTDD